MPRDESAIVPALRALRLVVLLTVTCRGDEYDITVDWPSVTARRPPPPGPSAILVGAGDIATCARSEDAATARLVQTILRERTDAVVFTTGDNAYPGGSPAAYTNCYEPTWGAFKTRTRPVPGNASYRTDPAATGYYRYFGERGAPPLGYYSYELGAWHIVALNSSLPMEAGSRQEQWLRADLASSRKTCTLAYWHVPRFSSGQHGADSTSAAIWRVLYAHRAEVVVTGHDHNYERFQRQTPDGVVDSAGIRQFVVGTGGTSLRPLRLFRARHSVLASDRAHGVIKFTLFEGGYYWEFIPVPGAAFRDAGTGICR